MASFPALLALRHLEKSDFTADVRYLSERRAQGMGEMQREQLPVASLGLQTSCPFPPPLPAITGLSLLLLLLMGVAKFTLEMLKFSACQRDSINIVQIETDFFFLNI